jgi:hypothetical protein
MEFASPQYFFCHNPFQFCSKLREIAPESLIWLSGTSESYIIHEYELGSIDGFRAVKITKRIPEVYEFDTLEIYIVALFLRDGDTVNPTLLDECGSWSGSKSIAPPFIDEPSMTYAQALITQYVAFRNVLFSTWTGATVGSTVATAISVWSDRISIQNYATPWESLAASGVYQERFALYFASDPFDEDRPPAIISVDPPGLPGASVMSGGYDPNVASAIRDLSNRDLVFSFGNGGPFVSWFGRSSSS